MIANAHPLRCLRKDGVWVGLEAVFGSGTWAIDATNTDFPFFINTVTDPGGTGVHVFNFQASQAKRAMAFASLEEPADDPANTVGHDVKVRAINLALGTIRVLTSTFAADPALVDPSDGARLRLWLFLETL
jgi:hypothetical protein